MQPRACLFSAFSIFIIAGTVTAAAAEMDVSKCGTGYKQWQDAFNQGDTSTAAALYASDAVEVTPDGIRRGPAAVKNRLDEALKQGWKKDVVIVPTKCDIEGAVRWSSGSWKQTSPQGSSVGGFWTVIEVEEGNGWKVQNLTFNQTSPPLK
jgi:ketosteroid isomerase-like protein